MEIADGIQTCSSRLFSKVVLITMFAGSRYMISRPPPLMKGMDSSACLWTPSTRPRSSKSSVLPNRTCVPSTCLGSDSSARSAPPLPVRTLSGLAGCLWAQLLAILLVGVVYPLNLYSDVFACQVFQTPSTALLVVLITSNVSPYSSTFGVHHP